MSLVSIVMPVYNGGQWLAPCIDSLVAQTHSEFELVIVDDASTDETPRILQDLTQRDERVRVITHGRNAGAGASRNDGLAQAQGDYLLFLDSDDLFGPTLIERALGEATASGAEVVLFGADEFVASLDDRRPNRFYLDADGLASVCPFSPRDIPDRLFQLCTPEPWSKLFARCLVERESLRFQSLQNANDLYFTMAALAHARLVSTCAEVLVHHRVGRADSVQARKASQPLAFLDALRALRDDLASAGLLDELRVSFANLAAFHCLFNDAAPADWPAVFAEFGVNRLAPQDFAIPGDYERCVAMVLGAGKENLRDCDYGVSFWRNAAYYMFERAQEAEAEVARTKRSLSLALGEKVTWLPRKVRSILKGSVCSND